MNFASVRFLNTHVHSEEWEEKRPSGEKPTTKTVTQVLLVNPPTPKWNSQTRHVTRKWRRYSERRLLTTGVAAEEPQTQTAHAHTYTHTHQKLKKNKKNCKWPLRAPVVAYVSVSARSPSRISDFRPISSSGTWKFYSRRAPVQLITLLLR